MNVRSPVAAAFAVTAAATSLLTLTFGLRAVLGMFIGPINSATGLGFAAVSLALAVSQLVAGVSQPLCGALSDRFGPARIVVVGGVLLALGTAMLTLASSQASLMLAFGLVAAATGAVGSTPVLLAAVNARVAESRRGIATGIVGSGASLGQFALPPLTQLSMGAAGWANALIGLALLSLAALPLARVLPATPSRRSPAESAAAPGEGVDATPREAFADARYWAIAAGFAACGFHVAFMLAHMPGVIEGCGFSGQLAGTWFSIMGLANMAGSIGIGFALQCFAPKRILALIYAARALGLAVFLWAPKTEAVLIGFALWMGVTYMATMPPTAAM
ncbi:MAG: MFS transporter, partial [Betaproteobacteria bacterium]